MSMLTEIKSLVTKPVREFKKVYTEPDEIYIIWFTGYTIGKCLLEAEKFLYLKKSDLLVEEVRKTFTGCFLQLKSSFDKLSSQTPVIDEKNTLWEDFVQKINESAKEKGNIKKITDHLKNMKFQLETEIHAYSTHLANVFLFGYQLIRLKTAFLYERQFDKVMVEIGNTEEIIASINKGDKSLNSPNLELVHENLRLLTISLELIRKNIKKLSILKRSDFTRFEDKVNECYGIWEDILLDIKNPEEIIRGRFYVFIIYYYVLVFILGLIQLLYENLKNSANGNVFQSEFFKTNAQYLIAFVVPGLIWLLVFLYRKMRHIITRWLLKRRFFDIISD